MDYSRNFGSNFPNKVIGAGTKKDIDSNVSSLIKQYYDYMDKQDVASANKLYENNKSKLSAYKISMADYNLLQEELYNIGIYALKNTKLSISTTEPADMEENSTWIELLQ